MSIRRSRSVLPLTLGALALIALIVPLAGAAAQTAPTPAPQPRSTARSAEAPTPKPAANRTYTFQLVLLVADTAGPNRFENVPANAQKALEDVKGFLPYSSYRLLDLAWLRSSHSAEAQMSGPDGRTLSAGIRFYAEPSEADRIEIQRLVIVESQPMPMLLEAPRSDGAPTAMAPAPPVRPLLETSFGMKAGETVVVGTAKLDGPSKALVVLLSALP